MTKGYDITKSKAWNNTKLNPHLHGLGGVQPQVGQQKAERALVGESSGHQKSKRRMDTGCPVVRVALINLRGRLLDSDNLITGFKPLRDAIARWLGLDDADNVIEWEYSQQLTRGAQGTIVRIEKM